MQKNGALDRIRTYGTLLRRQVLYPLSYEGATFAMLANKRAAEAKMAKTHTARRGESPQKNEPAARFV